jgi:hypothetical protein
MTEYFIVATMESPSYRKYKFTRPAAVFELEDEDADVRNADPKSYYLIYDDQ